jgi:uncharacterized MnhB-related membrane protein
MTLFEIILLTFLIACAIAASLTKRLLTAVVVFMGYSLVMSVLWLLLEAPDLAITEAAVGAGITTILFVVNLRKFAAIQAGENSQGENSHDE